MSASTSPAAPQDPFFDLVAAEDPAPILHRLRETDPDWAPRCLFRVELGTGSHVGPSGRLDHLRYEAAVAAWLLERLGATKLLG